MAESRQARPPGGRARPPGGRSRYGRYAGGPDPLAPPVDLSEALDAIGNDVMAGYSPERAVRELLRRGTGGREGLDDLTRRINALERELTDLVRAQAPQLLKLPGCGPLTAAKLLGETANPARFRSEACFAMHAGVAPIPASSGRTQRHRLARGGNRQLNAALHRIAITQVRITASPGQLYYQRRRAQGDTAMEALRALKRRLARVVFNLLQADTTIAINDLSTAA